MAKKKTPKAPKTPGEKLAAVLKNRGVGKACYAKADALLEELIATHEVGSEIIIPSGAKFRLVDQFENKNKVFKPCGVARFDVVQVPVES